MKAIFDRVSIACSKVTTRAYSTSFTLGILCLDKELRDPIYSIYGFVRSADEIVDSFHDYDKQYLLRKFREDTWEAIENRISLNPILNSFQSTAHEYQIDRTLIDQFLKSMEMDLEKKNYNEQEYQNYIFGSAEAVGLMCLKVFCHHQPALFDKLCPFAMSLGSAFQKINFLRDINEDINLLGRSYFPGVELSTLNEGSKRKIEENISADLAEAFKGIKQLPRTSRLGVYVAYVYYVALFKKIKNTATGEVLKRRIRIRNRQKATLLAFSYVKHQLNQI